MSSELNITPEDEFNRSLIDNVHPHDWVNPTPNGRYNLVVIGAGTAGLVTAAGAAGLGAKVALIEKHLMGGDCLNVGCVPSKALIRAAKSVSQVQKSGKFGVHITGEIHVNFPEIMERMRKIRAEISPLDSASRFRDLGVDVFIGEGNFLNENTIQVEDHKINFKNAVISTGARAVTLPIEGMDQVDYLTNENLFNLTELPLRLVVIGGGPIGCEMAQAFARFGSQVTLIDMNSHVLAREDSDAAKIIQMSLKDDGIDLILDANIQRVSVKNNQKTIHFQQNGKAMIVEFDQILLSAGRKPNVENLNLDSLGIKYDQRKGVEVDDRLRTSQPNIFAAGDVCFPYKFTHTADFQARIVIANSLFKARSKTSSLTIPWCTYTDPEIAHVGMYADEAEKKELSVQTFVQPLKDVDRAILDGEENGFVKIHVKKGTDQILGATIVASHAGDMISEITLAMNGNIGLKKIAKTIHPYPTQADAIRKIGDQYNRSRLTDVTKSLFSKWLKWTR